MDCGDLTRLLSALCLDCAWDDSAKLVNIQKSIAIAKINERQYKMTLEMLISFRLAFLLNIEKSKLTGEYTMRCNSMQHLSSSVSKIISIDRFLLCLD